VSLSSQAIRIRAEVAGAGKLKSFDKPFSARYADIASLIAKYAVLPIKSGGSPTA